MAWYHQPQGLFVALARSPSPGFHPRPAPRRRPPTPAARLFRCLRGAADEPFSDEDDEGLSDAGEGAFHQAFQSKRCFLRSTLSLFFLPRGRGSTLSSHDSPCFPHLLLSHTYPFNSVSVPVSDPTLPACSIYHNRLRLCGSLTCFAQNVLVQKMLPTSGSFLAPS